jgi:uncharacterized protein
MKTMSVQTIIILILVGLVAGMLGGMIGIGGGVVIVPALVYFLGMSQKTAQGTSLGLLILPVAILGFINYYKQGHVDYKYVFLIAIGFVAGSYFGSKLALTLPDEKVKKIFAIVIILIAIKMLFLDKAKTNTSLMDPNKIALKNKTE